MARLHHIFRFSERDIFLQRGLDIGPALSPSSSRCFARRVGTATLPNPMQARGCLMRNKSGACRICDARNSAPEDYLGETRSMDRGSRRLVDAGAGQSCFCEVGNGAAGGAGRSRHSGQGRPWAWPSRLARQSWSSLRMVHRPRQPAPLPSLTASRGRPDHMGSGLDNRKPPGEPGGFQCIHQ
jgi:hypothetical protein